MKIGLTDSGLGGLTIFKNIYKEINGDFIYLADNLNAPYGIKTVEEVQRLTTNCAQSLINMGCQIIIIACNTATSAAVSLLREKYPDIIFIGTEPAIKPALDNCNNKKILLTATSLTLKEKKLKLLLENLNASNLVELVALDKLVEFADKSKSIQFDNAYEYLKEKFTNYDFSDFSGIVLGCTHFPLFINEFKKLIPNHINFYDSADGIKRNLIRQILKINPNYNFETHSKSLEIILTKEDALFKQKCIELI